MSEGGVNDQLPEGINLETLKPEQVTAVVLYRGLSREHQSMYAYLAVRMDRMEAFKQDVGAEKPMDLRDYGEVLASGLGSPPPEVMRRMAQEYGFDHGRMMIFSSGNQE